MSEPEQVGNTANQTETVEELFLKNQPTIQKIADHVARRYRLSSQDREEFRAEVNLKLISEDYKSLRNFQGRCKLESYLFLIINRAFWEWRNKMEGRWRPSAQAKRLGEAAIKLESLTHRDGYLFSEACQILNHHYGLKPSACEALMQQLPVRIRREIIPGANLDELASPRPDLEQKILDQERENLGFRVRKSIKGALAKLPQEDLLIIKLNFHQNIKIVDISRSLGVPVKKMYKRVKKILAGLNKDLKRAGFATENSEALLEAVRVAAISQDSDDFEPRD